MSSATGRLVGCTVKDENNSYSPLSLSFFLSFFSLFFFFHYVNISSLFETVNFRKRRKVGEKYRTSFLTNLFFQISQECKLNRKDCEQYIHNKQDSILHIPLNAAEDRLSRYKALLTEKAIQCLKRTDLVDHLMWVHTKFIGSQLETKSFMENKRQFFR